MLPARAFWPLALARELDDAILHLRLNEEDIGTWVFRTSGEAASVEAADRLLSEYAHDWLVREITLYLKRTFQRLDVSARSLIALVEPGSCFHWYSARTGVSRRPVVYAGRQV